MIPSSLHFPLALVSFAMACTHLLAADPDPLAVLASAAGPQEKSHACLKLAATGDAKAVPALAALLGDPALADYARTALEEIPDPAAAKALRDATATLNARFLAGVVNSLGVKRDTEAVELLVKLANDPSKGVGPQALMALAHIASPQALDCIRKDLDNASADTRVAAAHAALAAANRMENDGKQAPARDLRAAVAKAQVPAWMQQLAAMPELSRKEIFNGKNLDGWNGDPSLFRVEMGTLLAGHLDRPIPRNEFLVSAREYADFELQVKVRVVGGTGNGGIQIRSQRANDGGMSGYQADAAPGYWGGLYDEGRRKDFLAPRPSAADLAGLIDPGGWNQYVIRCEGPRIRLWLNGKLTTDFTETDAKIPRSGFIGLQIHGGPAAQVRYKDVWLTEFGSVAK